MDGGFEVRSLASDDKVGTEDDVVDQVQLRNDDGDSRGLDARLEELNRRFYEVLKEQAAKHPKVAKPQKKAQKKPL